MTSLLARLLRDLGDGGSVDADALREITYHDAEVAHQLVELSRKMDALRQRSAELRAVMSSTKDLLALPDPDLLLQRIVDRAHELLEIDVAYLSVYEPVADELYVRAVTGVISPRFFGMVVPAGVGVASVAVHTQHPQWVEDYAAHTGVPHDPTIDAIMREEQLRSLLGAPMVVGGTVLGVLFAATRQPHAFRPDEIALLSEFAGHAGLVLHVAQLLRQATDATADAASRQRDAEWAASLHGELTRLVVFGHDAEAVVGALSEALGREVTFVDMDGDVIVGKRLPTELHLGESMRAAAASGHAVDVDACGFELLAPVMSGRERAGALLVANGERKLRDVERRTVERAGLIAALLMLRRNALADAEERVRGELATEILDGATHRDAALRRAAERGYPVERPWIAMALVCASEERPHVRARLRSRKDWLVASGGSGVTVLTPDTEDMPEQVREAAGKELRIVFSSAENLEAAAARTAELWQTALLAEGLGLPPGVMDALVLAPYASLFHGDGRTLEAFIDRMLGPVKEWDGSRGTVLSETLLVLCDERWSLSASARSLRIHLNTMKQRMRRLRGLLGSAVDEPESRFRIELAVRVDRARRAAIRPYIGS